eukprot:SM000027S09631  [mRNA]  locus=s27:409752:414077:+ [translate_table: standard]
MASRPKRRRIAASSEAWQVSSAPGGADGRRGLYHCNYCQKDVSGTVRIKCAKCPDFDLCLECFSVGAELSPHKASHPYRVMDNLNFSLLHPDWAADEEILLLEAVEMFGLGNWAEVSEHVGTKGKVQCQEHFTATYMDSPCSPLPDLSGVVGKSKAELLALGRQGKDWLSGQAANAGGGFLPKVEDNSEAGLREEPREERSASPEYQSSEGKEGQVAAKSRGAWGAVTEGGEGGARGAKKSAGGAGALAKKEEDKVPTPPTEESMQSNRTIGGKTPSKPPLHTAEAAAGQQPASHDTGSGGGAEGPELAGYNAKRGEFDPEYDNEAELPLAEMEFRADEDADRELKIRMLHIYRSRLAERRRRKEFILERGLLSPSKRLQVLDRRRGAGNGMSKEAQELWAQARVFARYHSQASHEALVAGLIEERRLRQQIEELQELREAGCHELAEGAAYLAEKRRQEAETSLRRQRESPAAHLYGAAAASAAAAAAAGRGSNHRTNRQGARAAAAEGADHHLGTTPNSMDNDRSRTGGLAGTPASLLDDMALVKNSKSDSRGPLNLDGHLGLDLLSDKASRHGLSSSRACCVLRVKPYGCRELFTACAGSPPERQLCASTRLLPVHYLKMKEVLMLEALKQGGGALLSRADSRKLFRVSPAQVDRVYDFLCLQGWISGDSLPTEGAGIQSHGSSLLHGSPLR